MLYGYFTPDERQKIAQMWEAYQPVAIIACALMVHPSTIYRELRRGNKNGELDRNKRLKYDPQLAQENFQLSINRRGAKKVKEGK